MSHNPLVIKDGALFVADVHFNPNRREFLEFLTDIKSGKLEATQLFLMGDIFDFLSSEIEYFVSQNKVLIDLINQLSNKIEVFYFEGNHDYNLSSLFPNLLVFKRELQPIIFKWDKKNVALAHGDIFTPVGYSIYTKIIRNHQLLLFLNMCDKNNWLTKKIDFWLRDKYISHMFSDFDSFASSRIENYKNNIDADIFIEGHFHQGNFFQNNDTKKLYLNLPAFGVEHSYMRIEDGEIHLACYLDPAPHRS